MIRHVEFIRTELATVVSEAVIASRCIPVSIAATPICGYIFQALFLKMTGFQEQKMKCLCWELATGDYVFRRFFLQNYSDWGELSSYDSKKKIYQKLIEMITKRNSSFDLATGIDRTSICDEIRVFLLDTFSSSSIGKWNERELDNFDTIFKKDMKPDYLATDMNQLLAGQLFNIYDQMYDHRNRCAHNVQSYQQNLPTLRQLADANYRFENYYVRFAILLLIDKVFINLFNIYEDLIVM